MKKEKNALKVLNYICLSVIFVFSLMTFIGCGGGGSDSNSANTANKSDNNNLFPTDTDIIPDINNVISINLDDGRTINVAEGRIIVDFTKDATIDDYYAFKDFLSAKNATIIGQITNLRCLQIETEHPESVDTLISEITDLSYIEYATYDRLYSQLRSNDIPGNMKGKWWTNNIELEKAWKLLETLGVPLGNENIKIGIVDGGIGQRNTYFDQQKDGLSRIHPINSVDDYNVDDHGTTVAAIAAADSPIIVGVAPDTTILSYSIKKSYFSDLIEIQSIRKGIEACVNKGAQIINVSQGGQNSLENLKDFRWDIRKAIEYAANKGRLVVLAEGNLEAGDGTNLNDDSYFPAGNQISDEEREEKIKYENYYDSNVIIVSGTVSDSKNTLCVQYGIVTTIAAPYWYVTHADDLGNVDTIESGTSYSAPMVSGAAALLLSLNDKLSPQKIRNILIDSGTDCTHGIDSGFSYAGKIKSLNIYNALYFAKYDTLNYNIDADSDGKIDSNDNCPDTYNPDQTDTDSNGVGDACETNIITGDSVWIGGNFGSVAKINKTDISVNNISIHWLEVKDLAVDDKYVWVLIVRDEENDSGRLYKINKNTLEVKLHTLLSTGDDPAFIAVDDSYIWLTYGELSAGVQGIPKNNPENYENWKAFGWGGTFNNPFGIAVDDKYVWVTDYGSQNLIRYNKNTKEMTTINTNHNSNGIAVDEQFVWVSCLTEDLIVRINKSTLEISDPIMVGDGPMGIESGKDYVWVANWNDFSATRINKNNLNDVMTVDVQRGPINVSVDENYAWVTQDNLDVIRIDQSSLSTKKIDVSVSISRIWGDMTGYNYNRFFNNN